MRWHIRRDSETGPSVMTASRTHKEVYGSAQFTLARPSSSPQELVRLFVFEAK